ncbi:glycosyltransferase family 39 protein [Pseudomonas sp. H1h]|uniref:glycosyltransferase family 39 protein n=1 Tax=Pseudomonas sp. H1h TaxID=1397280 RepID=UPI0009DD6523|nr:glycosyltransferase family 39 protein [Pseudomonas sp. H1h]
MKPLLAVPFLNAARVPASVDRLALLAVLVIALGVRFYSITVPVIWYDEAYSLLLARETPTRIWAMTALDVHPPLYYVLLHYWGIVWGDSPLAARAFSVLADVGTLLLCIKLMSLIATRRATWIAALLLALLPISVRYSQEVRMYALLGFLLMSATVALVCWARAPEQKRYAVVYVLLMTAAFYTHYFAGLCVLVHWLFWWQSRVTGNGTAIAADRWLIANSAVVFWYLPWVPSLLNQLADTTTLGWIKPVTLQGALSLVWQFTVMGDDSSKQSVSQLLPFALMLLCACIAVVGNSGERRFRVLLVGYFFVPVTALYLTALFLPSFVPRYLVFTAPALAMITGMALDVLFRRWPLWANAALVFFIVGQLCGLTEIYRQTDGLNGTDQRRKSGFSQLILQLNQVVRPKDEIIMSNPFWFPTFAYYSNTSINPKFEVHSSIDDFLRSTRRGAFSLINDPVASSYLDGVTFLDCRSQRIWWITDSDLSVDRPLFAKDRAPSLTLYGGDISAYLFTPESVPAPARGGTKSMLKLPLSPAAQNCPPAPFATSANRTRRSLPQ